GLVGRAGGDLAGGRLGADRPLRVVARAQGTVRAHLVTALAQSGDQGPGHGFVHVGGDGDPHAIERSACPAVRLCPAHGPRSAATASARPAGRRGGPGGAAAPPAAAARGGAARRAGPPPARAAARGAGEGRPPGGGSGARPGGPGGLAGRTGLAAAGFLVL